MPKLPHMMLVFAATGVALFVEVDNSTLATPSGKMAFIIDTTSIALAITVVLTCFIYVLARVGEGEKVVPYLAAVIALCGAYSGTFIFELGRTLFMANVGNALDWIVCSAGLLMSYGPVLYGLCGGFRKIFQPKSRV